MITREADYALRAIIYLAKHADDGYSPTSEICEAMEIPYRFLRKISRAMVDSGIVKAQRGKQGGLLLGVDPKKLSLLEILKIFDKRALAINLCCRDKGLCSRAGKCEAHEYFASIQRKLEKEFSSVTIADLIQK